MSLSKMDDFVVLILVWSHATMLGYTIGHKVRIYQQGYLVYKVNYLSLPLGPEFDY